MFKIRLISVSLLTLSLVLTWGFFPSHTSNAEALQWSRVNTPASGQSGKWVLAPGSDINHLTLAPDGTLYCSANPSNTEYRLFKSSDHGYSWGYTGKIEDQIVDIAVLPDNSSVVFYATTSQLFKSTDAAARFSLASSPILAHEGEQISSLDITSDNGSICILVGTRNTLSSEYGGVYYSNESQSSEWINTEIGNFDIFCVAFSPGYGSDKQLIAVAGDELDAIIMTDIDNTGWNQSVGEARIRNLEIESADIAFPTDYDSNLSQGNYTQFLSLNSGHGQGGIFKITGNSAPSPSSLSNLNIGSVAGADQDIASLAVAGNGANAFLMAGSADANQVYLSENSGNTWTAAVKPPSGESNTQVILVDDFTSTGLAYAASMGSESAFSISADWGENWDQTGLIDTQITKIQDLAISPDYEADGALFLLTTDILNSLWRSNDRGATWKRILIADSVDRIDRIALSPQYAADNTVFLAGKCNGNPFIWKSENCGLNFVKIASVYEDDPVYIDTWTINQDGTLLVGAYDGSDGLVYTFEGTSYIDRSEAGNQALNSIVISPYFAEDKTILVGNTFGGVYFSTDNGFLFEPLPMDSTDPPFSESVSLAFDPEFALNRTIYAADARAGGGIYRFIMGTSIGWESIDSTLPAGSLITQLITGTDGILYAVNSQEIDTLNDKGGIQRCLRPDDLSVLPFENLVNGLENGGSLYGLWIKNDTLWTIDTINSRLLTYTDTLGTCPDLNSPLDGASGLPVRDLTISWETLEGASSYLWQIDTNPGFLSVPEKKGTLALNSVELPLLESGTTYYWRVKAISPISSMWSEARSFTTASSPGTVAPTLLSPKSGALTSQKPIFSWSVFNGAETYDLLVSLNDIFSNPVIDKTADNACSANTWACDVTLEYDTSYYWKVRACVGGDYSQWSEVSAFKTKPESTSGSGSGGGSKIPKPSPTPTPAPSPSPTPPISPSPEAASPTPQPPVTPVTTSVTSIIPVIQVISTTTVSQPPQEVTPTPSAAAETDSWDSLVRIVVILVVGLIFLSIILLIAVIFVTRKFKKY